MMLLFTLFNIECKPFPSLGSPPLSYDAQRGVLMGWVGPKLALAGLTLGRTWTLKLNMINKRAGLRLVVESPKPGPNIFYL